MVKRQPASTRNRTAKQVPSHWWTVIICGGNTLRAFGRLTNGFAWGLGGGLDYNASENIAIRVIQADYLRTRLSNTWFNDARLGFGIVLKF